MDIITAVTSVALPIRNIEPADIAATSLQCGEPAHR